MYNLNEMRELNNVVSQLANNQDLLKSCYKIADKNCEI